MMSETSMYSKSALEEALRIEYAWLETWDEREHEHVFSDVFNKRMEKIKTVADRKHVSFGRHRISRLAACALIAAIFVTMLGCGFAVRQAIIYWNETSNSVTETLDITFEVDDPDGTLVDLGFREPEAPAGYSVAYSSQDGDIFTVVFSQAETGKQIDYMQIKGVDVAGLSIDNDGNGFMETEVNGYKGYVKDDGTERHLIWCDGSYVYAIYGNDSVDLFRNMAEKLN